MLVAIFSLLFSFQVDSFVALAVGFLCKSFPQLGDPLGAPLGAPASIGGVTVVLVACGTVADTWGYTDFAIPSPERITSLEEGRLAALARQEVSHTNRVHPHQEKGRSFVGTALTKVLPAHTNCMCDRALWHSPMRVHRRRCLELRQQLVVVVAVAMVGFPPLVATCLGAVEGQMATLRPARRAPEAAASLMHSLALATPLGMPLAHLLRPAAAATPATTAARVAKGVETMICSTLLQQGDVTDKSCVLCWRFPVAASLTRGLNAHVAATGHKTNKQAWRWHRVCQSGQATRGKHRIGQLLCRVGVTACCIH